MARIRKIHVAAFPRKPSLWKQKIPTLSQRHHKHVKVYSNSNPEKKSNISIHEEIGPENPFGLSDKASTNNDEHSVCYVIF